MGIPKASKYTIRHSYACGCCIILPQARGVSRMRAARRRRYCGKWLWGIAVYSAALLACWPVPILAGEAQGSRQDNAQTRARITVERGELSVDLRQADLQAVMAQIAEQAGITIIMDPKGRRTISTEFTNVELEAGIRRLLRGTSLSHTILYTREPAGTVAIKEVRVFGEGSGSEPLQPAVAKAEENTSGDDVISHAAPPLTQTPEDSPLAAGAEGSNAAASFLEAFELARRRAPQAASPTPEGKESEVIGAFRNLLQQQPH
jgi:hypothetical protein